MFGIGSTELLVIFVVALIVLGPKSIPQLAKTLGKVMGEFKRVSTDFQRTMNAEMEVEEHEKRKKEAEQELFGDRAGATASAPPPSGSAATTSAPSAPSPVTPTVSAESAANAPHDTTVNPAPEQTGAQAVTAPADTDTFAPDSPLAKAVAKAEAEAAERAAGASPSSADNVVTVVTDVPNVPNVTDVKAQA